MGAASSGSVAEANMELEATYMALTQYEYNYQDQTSLILHEGLEMIAKMLESRWVTEQQIAIQYQTDTQAGDVRSLWQ